MFEALEAHPITGLDVLIIGSNVPWYEAICLAFGAASCTTVEYNALRYDHPGLATVTVAEFEASRTRQRGSGIEPRRWDVAWSISSFEHDGLGRYGDDLNPSADFQAMARVREYLKEGTKGMGGRGGVRGKLFLSLPVGRDEVVWNAQRVYGPIRLPLLLAGWEAVGVFGHEAADFEKRRFGHEPIFVLAPSDVTAAQAPPHYRNMPRSAAVAVVGAGGENGAQRVDFAAELAGLQLQRAILDQRIDKLKRALLGNTVAQNERELS